jgi:hypothetical protein
VAKNWSGKSRCPRITTMEPADARKCDDRASARRLDRARDGRGAIERPVRSVLVVIGDVFADLAEQMPPVARAAPTRRAPSERPQNRARDRARRLASSCCEKSRKPGISCRRDRFRIYDPYRVKVTMGVTGRD